MKPISLISIFLLSSLTCNAQQLITPKKNGGEKQADYLFASAGVSVPVGFINTKHYVISANTGPMLTLGYHHFYNKRWGMGLVASGSSYNEKIQNNLYYPTSDTWQRAQLYISASYTFLLKHRLAIDLVQGMGVYYMKTPSYDDLHFILYNNGYNVYSYIENVPSKHNWNTSYNIGIKSRFLVKENIGLIFSINYFNAFDAFMNGALGFNSIDCQLGAVIKLKKKK